MFIKGNIELTEEQANIIINSLLNTRTEFKKNIELFGREIYEINCIINDLKNIFEL